MADASDFQRRIKLEEELALARENVNEEVLAELKRQDQLSETERLLERKKALEAEQEELIRAIEFEEQLNADLTEKKKQFLELVTEKYGAELQKQEDLLRKSIDRQLAMYRELAIAQGGVGGSA